MHKSKEICYNNPMSRKPLGSFRKEKGIMKYIIKASGMSCGHCINRVRSAMLALGAEIEKLELNDIVIEADTDEDTVRNAVEDLGFDVLSIEKAK